MTEKRFQWVFIKDNELELRDNGIVKRFNNERLEELLNELHEERGIAIDGIKIADELINKYGSDELKYKWKKEVTIKI